MTRKEILEAIFEKKSQYEFISDEDKQKWEFMLNRAFARKYPMVAYFLNKKESTLIKLDYWFEFFKKENRIPGWAWGYEPKVNKILKTLEVSSFELELLKQEFGKDFDNLVKNL